MARFVADFLPASCPNCGERFKWGSLGRPLLAAGGTISAAEYCILARTGV